MNIFLLLFIKIKNKKWKYNKIQHEIVNIDI
jgi:hypothetical protein